MPLLLAHGYNDLGIQALLDETRTPKGSFYHHFRDKEDFALQVVDRYMHEVHGALDVCLNDASTPPLDRVRHFFELTELAYRQQGYMGCLLGGLGQELSGVSAVFRRKIEECISSIAKRLAGCLDEARRAGQLPRTADTGHLAQILVNCWEGAALRSRLRSDASPLLTMLDFYFDALGRANPPRRKPPVKRRGRTRR